MVLDPMRRVAARSSGDFDLSQFSTPTFFCRAFSGIAWGKFLPGGFTIRHPIRGVAANVSDSR
jgi:hypothetical protein